ncbi:UDP-3-O-(3-hydroxymyristoyl)glucosamine N-acyltransferase [Candidatus Sumerlaeota bacterium]|nr:UDP-3-O-(3-hydroxymyristoyl)glucosamine N-acyltransferase [Candidatus Sumerlaeota bacterium]
MKQKQFFSLHDLAQKTGGRLVPSSEGEREISGFTTLDAAGANDLSFVVSDRFRKEAAESKAGAIILPEEMEVEGRIMIQVKQVWKAVIRMMELFYPEPQPSGEIHKTAFIHPEAIAQAHVTIGPYSVIEKGARIGEHSVIGALCYIGKNVSIGNHCLIHPHVTILKESEIGNRVILSSGVVIGSDGFKYELIDGVPAKIPQVGKVVLEDDVEIGSNTCIDKASLTETRIHRGTKLDNLIQIAHNVEIGSYCMIAAQTGVAGSVKIGNGCIMGGQVGIKDNIAIGDGVMIGAKSGIMNNTPSGSKFFGYIAMPGHEALKREAMINRLPKLQETVKNLEKRIRELEEKFEV